MIDRKPSVQVTASVDLQRRRLLNATGVVASATALSQIPELAFAQSSPAQRNGNAQY